ncbi:TetR family transcriptional regulator [Rhodobacterales bacterium HKCCE2091]|nr:TetR family transcriptional regulator [Rhodobacterales bacterium HKCCE2091]
MSQEIPRRGRPPSAASRRKALAAAHAILMEEGFGRLSVEAVAARSGVGKPTIYRHWANASELAMAALMEGQPEADTPAGDLPTALTRQLTSLVQAFATTRGRQIALALAAADPETEMTRAFRSRVILSSREAGRRLVLSAVASGEIGPCEDLETVLDMIYAPLFYRLLLGHQPLSPDFARGLVRAAMAVLRDR